MLATVRPRDIAGKTRRRMAADELTDLVAVDKKLKKINAELKTAVQDQGSTLMDIHGIGPAGAARILADVGDIARFADRNRFASWTGTAPLEASSGEQIRHRLSRAGNRRMNHVLHIAAIVQLRHDTEGRAYYRRKLAAGKTPMEALRCLKRRLSDVIYRRLVADAQPDDPTADETGPGGHCGATLQSSAVDLHPHIDTSDKPLPGPAQPTLQPTSRARKTPERRLLNRLLDTEGSQIRTEALDPGAREGRPLSARLGQVGGVVAAEVDVLLADLSAAFAAMPHPEIDVCGHCYTDADEAALNGPRVAVPDGPWPFLSRPRCSTTGLSRLTCIAG